MNPKTNDITMENRVAFLEENRRFIQNSLESALKLGDFQEKVKKNSRPQQIFEETEKRINSLIQFEVRAFCLVNKDDFDLVLKLCEPEELRSFLQDEIEFMIEKRFMAWAMRERRGVNLLSKDQKQRLQQEVDQKTQEILRYERQLLQAQKTEAIATLAGGIAHEFNNALSAVVGCLELSNWIF